MTTSITAEQYLEGFFEPDELLERVNEGIRANDMPEISVAAGYGRLLTMLVRITGAKEVLEIGALGGYSGICLARGLPHDGKLVSLELKQEYADLAFKHVSEAGFGGNVEYRIGEALDSLKALDAEGRKFNLFFIDADKGNYPNYLEWAIKLARPGAIILGDNLLMRGKAVNPEAKGNAVTQMRLFTEAVARDPRLEGVLLPAYDGLAIARVRE